MLIGPSHADGPLLHHGQLYPGAVLPFQHGHCFGDGVGAGLDGDDLPLHPGRDHDLVEDRGGLLHRADDVAPYYLGARLHHGLEIPLLLPVQGGHLHTSGEVISLHRLHDDLQRALDAVVDVLDQAGAQFHGQGGAGGDHLRPGTQAGGLLIDLDGGGVPIHGQHFSDQALLAHPDHVGHVGLLEPGGHHQRAGDLDDFSHWLKPSF